MEYIVTFTLTVIVVRLILRRFGFFPDRQYAPYVSSR